MHVEENDYFDILMNIRNTLKDRIRFLHFNPAYPVIATEELERILSIIESSGDYDVGRS